MELYEVDYVNEEGKNCRWRGSATCEEDAVKQAVEASDTFYYETNIVRVDEY